MKIRGEDKILYLTTYTYHQLFNTKVNKLTATIVGFGLYLNIALIILYSYLLIRFVEVVTGLPFALSILIMAVLTLNMLLASAISCHINSNHCCVLGRTGMPRSNRMYSRRLWKSRSPVSVRVGTQFKLETNTYILHVFGVYIPDSLVNILLCF